MAELSGTGSNWIPEARDFSHERRLHRNAVRKRRSIMEKKIESAEEKLALIRKGFPKDPCRDCLFEEDDGCNCQDRKDYRAKLQHLRDIGVYDLMYDIQEIESQRSWIVWIRREKGENDERIASIQKEINELEKKCEDVLTQLKEVADEVKKIKNGGRDV